MASPRGSSHPITSSSDRGERRRTAHTRPASGAADQLAVDAIQRRRRLAGAPRGTRLSSATSQIHTGRLGIDALAAALDRARDAYGRHDWPASRDAYAEARALGELPTDDVFAFSDAAWWIGEIEEALALAEEAYRRFLQGDRPAEAAMTALQLAYSLYLRGDDVVASGWMSRARRLLKDREEGVEHGYLLYVDVEDGMGAGVADGVLDGARRIHALGTRFDDANLRALGTLAEGRALILLGKVPEGLALLDEAALAILSDELTPDWAGNIYCNLVDACHELGDIRRMGAWTDALDAWCERLSPATLFTGICRVHRAQLFRLRGAWDRAEEEATWVCAELATIDIGTVAEGWYAIGEIRRLRGDLAGAEVAYERARELGRDPQPGHSLLRLAGGNVDAAAASIGAALAGTSGPLARAPIRAAEAEIALSAGDLEGAGEACDELEEVAATFGSQGLGALARHWRGALQLEEGRAGAALETLLEARRRWQGIHATHDVARARLLLARAYRDLGDDDSGGAELAAALEVFEQLGAAEDLRRAEALRGGFVPPGGLTVREAEVLRLVAAGRSNREVATTLSISEKTVARHLSNIFTKLGVASRTEAAAYAFEVGLATAGPKGPGSSRRRDRGDG